MIAQDVRTAVSALGDLIASSKVIVPFTGAGISTECGIPDFRSPGGLWTQNRPIPFDEFVASQESRNEAWRRRFAIQSCFAEAAPGRGHLALAGLYKTGKTPAVITQNIDNLHQASGVAEHDVIELHGNTMYATCLDCSRRHEIDWVEQMFRATGDAPVCIACGGMVKTATISFGQAMPAQAMARAADLACNCDLFLAIGSSLVVWPAAGIPLLAHDRGARLVIINREPTDLDSVADLVIRQDIGETLGAFVSN